MEVDNKLKKALHDEARNQVAKGVSLALVFLIGIAASGWWLYLKPQIIKAAGGVPPGAVLAFDTPGDCPDGWSEYTEAAGRILVASGKSDNLTERKYREVGGSETHKLTVQQMPKHTHSSYYMVSVTDGLDSTTTNSGDMEQRATRTGPAGESEPFNIMQPYLVLKFCKKD